MLELWFARVLISRHAPTLTTDPQGLDTQSKRLQERGRFDVATRHDCRIARHTRSVFLRSVGLRASSRRRKVPCELVRMRSRPSTIVKTFCEVECCGRTLALFSGESCVRKLLVAAASCHATLVMLAKDGAKGLDLAIQRESLRLKPSDGPSWPCKLAKSLCSLFAKCIPPIGSRRQRGCAGTGVWFQSGETKDRSLHLGKLEL